MVQIILHGMTTTHIGMPSSNSSDSALLIQLPANMRWEIETDDPST